MTGSEYVKNMDLNFLVPALIKEGFTAVAAGKAISAYRSWLLIALQNPSLVLTPSREIDAAWHHHILHTERYHVDCERIFGRYLHHNPLDIDVPEVIEGWKNTKALLPAEADGQIAAGCVVKDPAGCVRRASAPCVRRLDSHSN